MNTISAKDFKKLYDAKARDWALFDVREKGETVDGHIFGASTLPRRLIEFRKMRGAAAIALAKRFRI